MDPRNLFQIFTNSTLLATRLLSSLPASDVQFHETRYCAVIFEDDPPSTLVTKIKASHKDGFPIRYSIVEGNQDGRFTIDQKSGEISLAAFLDRETQARHELVVAADAGSNPSQSLVQVTVADVNDNAPEILNQNPQFAVIEEDDRDLPLVLGKIEAQDRDWIDGEALLYTLSGDGVDGYDADDAFFSIDSRTGEIFQMRPLDRDPPKGKPLWKLRVKVHDGQTEWADMKSLGKSFDFYLPQNKKAKRSTEFLKSDLGKIRKKRQYGDLIKGEIFFTSKGNNERANYYRKSRAFEEWNEKRPFPIFLSKNKERIFVSDISDKVLFVKISGRDIINIHNNSNAISERVPSTINWYSTPDGKSTDIYTMKYKETRTRRLKEIKRPSNVKLLSKYLYFEDKRTDTGSMKRFNKRWIVNKEYYNLRKGKRYKNPLHTKKLRSTERLKSFLTRNKPSLRKKRNSRAPQRVTVSDTEINSSVLTTETKSGETNETSFGTSRPILDGGNCVRLDSLTSQSQSVYEAQLNYVTSRIAKGRARGKVHVTETTVTVIAKDVNDNAPTFLNKTIYGEVQENGPIDLLVAVLKAQDADDATSGTNALLTYSIEKNVVDEDTGDPLFAIHPTDGVLKTAVCCLDRETTPEYQLQVVASDGGGLKGTGTVIVRLSDLNDNSPRLSRREWTVNLDESDGNEEDRDATLFELTVQDPDTSNYFLYRIVPGSGNGWQKFGLRTKGRIGEIFSLSPLDYEDEKQKRGLRFLVEVTDRGPGGWDDRRHVDSAWVSVTLSDVNDNSPTFRRRHTDVTVSEDVPVGTLLETLTADDPDEGANGRIEYRLLDSWDSLQVSNRGEIRVQRPLDRESHPGTNGTTVRVIAVDHGEPPRTSTATLTVHLKDVNDCPPRLLPPTVLHVEENLPPKMIGTLIATDDDVWALGHGPPFQMKLSDQNSEFVKKRVRLRFRQDFDDGHGGAEVWTRIPLDREERRQLTVKVALIDAAGLSATSSVIVIIDDVNDNPMKPGSKTVFLWKTLSPSSEAPLGRVFVNDLDDWDIKDKRFEWADAPHPLFTLQESTGEIFASGQVREGRYDLKFNVSDSLWGQKNVAAKVTVVVRLLTPEVLSHAVPLTLTPTTAAQLTHDWIPSKGGGSLGRLTSAVKSALEGIVSEVRVVSVYEPTLPPSNAASNIKETNQLKRNVKKKKTKNTIDGSKFYSNFGIAQNIPSPQDLRLGGEKDFEAPSEDFPEPATRPNSACVWLSAKDEGGSYIDVVKFRGLLELKLKKIEGETNFTIRIGTTEESFFPPSHPSSSAFNSTVWWSTATADPSAAASLASKIIPLQVVDSNATSLVTPRLSATKKCSHSSPFSDPPPGGGCNHFQCLNGGKCIPTERSSRCVCPGHTTGPFCYVTSRSFSTNSWLWLDPLPQCLPLEVSFSFLTRYSDGMLLYSGPLSDAKDASGSTQDSPDHPSPPLIIIQLSNGRPQLILEGLSEPQRLEIKSSQSLNDGEWHTIHLFINNKGIKFMLDGCAAKSGEEKFTFSSCLVYSPWTSEKRLETMWGSSSPMQLGGMANEPPMLQSEDSSFQIVAQSLKGCISNLRIAGKLVDLGEPKYSYNSQPGCNLQDMACNSLPEGCSGNGICRGGLTSGTYCSCASGWTGSICEQPTQSVSLGPEGYIKVALSFTPDPVRLDFSLRLRTRLRNGIIFKLTSQHNFASLALKVQDGIACLIYSSRSEALKEPSTVSIVGITSTSSVKASNSSNIFYIKNWNQFEFDDKSNSTRTKPKSSTPSLEDKLVSSSTSVCSSGHDVSTGDWFHLQGGRSGYNLVLELSSEKVFHRNETLGIFDVYEAKFMSKVRKKIKEPPDKFIIDVREGLMIGDTPDVPDAVKKEDTSFRDPEICLEDFRISGKSMPLPPTVNGSRWGQVAAAGNVRVGCSSSSKCDLSTCPDDLVCVENWGDTSCRCPPHHTLSQHGCRAFDVCLFGPCLNGGVCQRNEDTFDCLCPSQFNGPFCQWRISNGKTGGNWTPIVAVTSTALLLIAVFILLFLCHRFRRKSLRKQQYKEESSDKSIKTALAELENEYIAIEINKKDKMNRKREESKSRKEKEVDLEREIKKEMDEIKRNIEEEKERRKSGFQNIFMFDEDPSGIVGEPLAVLLPRDDLRAYAYEGEPGSSEGSLGSAISEFRREINVETEESVSLTSGLGEVVDLLRNLPDASLHYQKRSGDSQKSPKLDTHKPDVPPFLPTNQMPYGMESELSTKRNKKLSSTKSEAKVITKRFTMSSSNEDLCGGETWSPQKEGKVPNTSKQKSKEDKSSSSFWYTHPGREAHQQPSVSIVSAYSPSSGRTDTVVSAHSPSSGRSDTPSKKSKSKSPQSKTTRSKSKNSSSKRSQSISSTSSKSYPGSKKSPSRSPKRKASKTASTAHCSLSASDETESGIASHISLHV